MNKKAKLLVIFLLVLLGGLIRFYKLGETRFGFFRDEAALGFNSWSILKTGADEYGKKFPVFFRSFEVFFLPAYEYLSLPFLFFIGLTEFSTRFLSAFSGTALIFVAFLIARQLFKSEKIGFFTALVVGVSPWSIFYSRGAFEGNLALLFFSLGFYFWLKFKNTDKNKFFYGSLIFFVFSMYSYQAPRLVVPLFLFLSVLLTKQWQKRLKLWVFGAVFVIFLYLPILVFSASPAGMSRATNVSLFSQKNELPGFSQKLRSWQYIYLIPREFLSLYLHYFSPNNLFSQSDYNPQRRVPNYSVFYFWQLPLLLVGFWALIRSDFKNKKSLLTWLLLAPLPAALTGDPFHTYRALLFFLPMTILIGLGFTKVIENIKKYKIVILTVVFVIVAYSVSDFIFNLRLMAPVINWRDWDYGYKEICQFVKTQPTNQRIVVDDPNTESYIHFLFYGVIPIKDYQELASAAVGDNYYSSSDKLRPEKIGRFEFKKVDWPNERGDKNTLFIFPATRLYPSEFANDPKLRLLKTIYSPSGNPAFYLIKTNN